MFHVAKKGPWKVLWSTGQGPLTLEKARFELCGCDPLYVEPGATLGVEAFSSRDVADKKPSRTVIAPALLLITPIPRNNTSDGEQLQVNVAWARNRMFNLAGHQVQEDIRITLDRV